jgi:5-methylcytosine-specific restriction endonuclease McrA
MYPSSKGVSDVVGEYQKPARFGHCAVCRRQLPKQLRGRRTCQDCYRPVKPAGPEAGEGRQAGRRFALKTLRAEILERDHYRCRYCWVTLTDKTANIDHVVAWPEGLTVRLNLVSCCQVCNHAKGSRWYVVPHALPGDPCYQLNITRKLSRAERERFWRSKRTASVQKRVHRHPLRDPWIREGPQRGAL